MAVLGVETHAEIEAKIKAEIEPLLQQERDEIARAHSGGARKRRYKISTKKRKYKYKKLNKNTLKNPYIR